MSDAPPLQGKATVIQVINGQPVTIEVDGTNAPITAGNFVDLVERGIYNGVMFHRVVQNPFVAQGGDPLSRDPRIPADRLGTGGFIDPDTSQTRFIPLEIKPQGAAQPVYNQIITQRPQLPHTRGAVAMARSTDLNTASSQFYFALDDLPSLDGSYAVFGYVTQGFDTVTRVRQGDRISAATVVGGIIPSRVSSIITDANLLNNFINKTNLVNLPLQAFRLPNTPNNYQVTVQNSQENPNGIWGGSANDRIFGSAINNAINGGAGSDTITSEAGDDFLRGGKDNDLISGGAGNDILTGNQGDDILNGDAGDDFLSGNMGKDVLIGGDGNDFLINSGYSNDSIAGGSGADTFVLQSSDITILLPDDSTTTILDFKPAEGDRIGLAGNSSNFRFIQSGNDTIIPLITGGTAVIQNVAPEVVQNATFAITARNSGPFDSLPLGDPALRIGANPWQPTIPISILDDL